MTAAVLSAIYFLLYAASFLLLYFSLRGVCAVRIAPLILGVTGCFFFFLLFAASDLLVTIFVALFAVFFTIQDPFRRRFYYFILAFILEECVSGVWIILLEFLFPIQDDHTYRLVCRICVLLCYALFFYLTQVNFAVRNKFSATNPHMSRRLYYLMILMALGMIAIASFLHALFPTLTSEPLRIISSLLIIISYLAIGGTILLYFQIVAANRRMREALQQEQMTNEMLQQYYDALLEKETDTKKYRHDMNNHLIGLRQLLAEENLSDMEKYLQSMQSSLDDIQSSVQLTGNPIIDAVSNYYRNRLPDKSTLRFSGALPESLPVDPYYYNMIYANLLQNATEAVLAQGEETGSPYISVQFIVGTHFLQTIIENTFTSTSKKSYLQNQFDPKNHGYGLVNARKATQALNGELDVKKADGVFRAAVSLPLK